MRCNGLPDPADPSDIRKYIHMWLLQNEREQTAKLNWLLTTNEVSVLTQDQRIDNMTRSYLKEQQHNIGDVVAGRVREVLGVCGMNAIKCFFVCTFYMYFFCFRYCVR